MITRPLDLVSKLRPAPRSYDFLFWVNAGLLGLFFQLFGSSFVLAPGVGLDFRLQNVPGARSGAAPITHRITVKPNGVIYIEDGPADSERLRKWLTDEAKKTRQPSLLIIASNVVPQGLISEIATAARLAGFGHVQLAAEEPMAEKH